MPNMLYPKTNSEPEPSDAVTDSPPHPAPVEQGTGVCLDSGDVADIQGPPVAGVKPKRPPSQIEWVCIMLESALGATEELADLTEDMRLRLYGQGDDYRYPGDIPADTAILPRLHILATRLQQQSLRAEANLADIGQIA